MDDARCFSPATLDLPLALAGRNRKQHARDIDIRATRQKIEFHLVRTFITRDRNKMAKSFLLYDISLWFIFFKEERKVEFGVSNDC